MNCEKCNKQIGIFTSSPGIENEIVINLQIPGIINGKPGLAEKKICTKCFKRYAEMSSNWFEKENKIENVILKTRIDCNN